ncbi:hypothetical protein Hden_2198 [Hyphomicrobium denitrificans ATCC 51888]|uniref:Uncharacterized protein n=1 Tax=Hyphomicrobium denitrificans (strain ATCC 51888 / DSM 1869 / NCIMB 11706 / TK 0415) TaxID=582899 RepID=D8JR11_HYPDA|nr:hypothetical protein [Hyphomicrobium denitrificans]ADJ23996.1 hypothetical protein Hden_2198 [Hyphomicrobium denitrificans ATCC 51888]
MKRIWTAAVSVGLAVAFGAPVAQADMISEVEGARAKERAGYYLNSQDREKLRRYGGNTDYRDSYARDFDYGRRGPGMRIYIGPDGYYGPGRY